MASWVLTIAAGTVREEQEVSRLPVCVSTSPFISYSVVPADDSNTATVLSVLMKPRTLLVFAPATSKSACIYNCMVSSHNQNQRALHYVQVYNTVKVQIFTLLVLLQASILLLILYLAYNYPRFLSKNFGISSEESRINTLRTGLLNCYMHVPGI